MIHSDPWPCLWGEFIPAQTVEADQQRSIGIALPFQTIFHIYYMKSILSYEPWKIFKLSFGDHLAG